MVHSRRIPDLNSGFCQGGFQVVFRIWRIFHRTCFCLHSGLNFSGRKNWTLVWTFVWTRIAGFSIFLRGGWIKSLLLKKHSSVRIVLVFLRIGTDFCFGFLRNWNQLSIGQNNSKKRSWLILDLLFFLRIWISLVLDIGLFSWILDRSFWILFFRLNNQSTSNTKVKPVVKPNKSANAQFYRFIFYAKIRRYSGEGRVKY
jgi:hypothetical protein